MPDTVILKPAYGRVYNSKESVMLDWNNGKSFKVMGGSYCSIRDYELLCEQFDRVIIHWITERNIGQSVTLFEHILRGMTSYV